MHTPKLSFLDRRTAARAALLAVGLAAGVPALTVGAALAASSVASAAQTATATFNFNDSTQYFTVPAGVSSINLTAAGGDGGNGDPTNGDFASPGGGGPGAYITETVGVQPGDTLVVMIGGAGGNGSGNPGQAGSGGLSSGDGMNGGAGASTNFLVDGASSGGGGGGTEVVDATQSNTVLVVAAGGGGGGGGNGALPTGPGGGGGVAYDGQTTGEQGTSGYGPGGAGGPGAASGSVAGQTGGSPESSTLSGAGGGGGGGYYNPSAGCFGGGDGGAGGGWAAYDAGGGGGGAGASYVGPDASNVVATENSLSDGNGEVTISWSAPPVPTSTTISVNPTTVAAGSGYSVTATVNGINAAPPSGTVDFVENGDIAGTAVLNGADPDEATFTTLAPPDPGAVTWQAEYLGDTGATGQPGDAASNSTDAIETVTPVVLQEEGTTTTVAFSSTPVAAGKGYTVTATVNGASGITATGTVEFAANGEVVASATLNGSDPDVATFTATAPTQAGSVTWTATYSGDANNDSSQSSPATETVTAPKPALSTASPSTGPAGTTVNLIGRNLSGATKVLFGTKAAKSFSCTSATSCRAVAPKGVTGTVDLYVVTPAGKSKLNDMATFVFSG